jgi:hypothetical protein
MGQGRVHIELQIDLLVVARRFGGEDVGNVRGRVFFFL